MSQSSRKEYEVWKVCTLLLSQDKSLTYQTIGDKLVELGYKRGSNSDIYKYLQSWRSQHYPGLVGLSTPPRTPSFSPSPSSPLSDDLKHVINECLAPIYASLEQLTARLSAFSTHVSEDSLTLNTPSTSQTTLSVLAELEKLQQSTQSKLEQAQKESAYYRSKIESLAEELRLMQEQVSSQTQRRHESERLRQIACERLKNAQLALDKK